MEIIKKLTSAAMAAALLIHTAVAQADEHSSWGDRNRPDAESTFTKWITTAPSMAGVVGGDVGEGTFTGEVLLRSVVCDTTKIEALYHFHGPKRSFTALVHVEQTGLNAVVIGIVTEGWLKGHSVKGEFTQITCVHDGTTSDCFEGTLKIDRDFDR